VTKRRPSRRRHQHTPNRFSTSTCGFRFRRLSHAGRRCKALWDFTTSVPRVLLSITLTGPASSDSADTSRPCRGCSHPPRHLPDQAFPASARPLRRPDGTGLSPPLKSQRRTAHEAGAQCVRDHLQRPDHPDRNLTNAKTRSTVIRTVPRRTLEQRRLRVSVMVLVLKWLHHRCLPEVGPVVAAQALRASAGFRAHVERR